MRNDNPATRRILDRWDAVIMLVVAVLFIAAGFSPIRPKPFGDGYFHNEAKAIAKSIKSLDASGIQRPKHAPGVTVYFALPYLFVPAGQSERTFWVAAVIWNSIAAASSALILRRAAEKLAGYRAGLLAAALALSCPMLPYYGMSVIGETPAYLGASLFTLGWSSIASSTCRDGWRPHLGMAAGVFLMVACRPNFLFVIPLSLALLGVCAIRPTRNAINLRRGVCSVLAGVFMLALLAVSLLNLPQRNGGGNSQFAFLTHVMVQGAFQFRAEPWDWRHWDDKIRHDSVDYASYAQTRLHLDSEHASSNRPLSDIEAEWLAASFLQEPGAWFRAALIKGIAAHVFLTHSRTPDSFRLGPLKGPPAYWLTHALLNLPHLCVFALAIAGGLSGKCLRPGVWGSYLPWVAVVLFTMGTYSEPRYAQPSWGAMAVAGAMFLTCRSQTQEAQQHLARIDTV